MNKQTKQKIFDLYFKELERCIEYDAEFHVDVQLTEGNKQIDLVSTLYAEEGRKMFTDRDQPPESERPYIHTISYGMTSIDENNIIKHHRKKCKQIVEQAIFIYKA